MEYPMKVYGPNVIEKFLADLLTILGWLLVAFAIGAAFAQPLFAGGFLGGLLVAGTALTGVMLWLGSSGLRQNRSAVDVGYFLFALMAGAWTLHGALALRLAPLLAGLIMLGLLALIVYLRQLSLQARFKPRFFSLRQFETMIQVADTMIDADGERALHPIDVAVRVDHFLHAVDSPLTERIGGLLAVVEWLLPLIVGRPIPFSDLGSNERRRAVEKVIGAGGLFRNVARGLKLLACAGYYGSVEGMAQVGYIPFEERLRSQGVDQGPSRYPEPSIPIDGIRRAAPGGAAPDPAGSPDPAPPPLRFGDLRRLVRRRSRVLPRGRAKEVGADPFLRGGG